MRTLTKDHLDNLRADLPPEIACPGMDVAEVIEALVATVDAMAPVVSEVASCSTLAIDTDDQGCGECPFCFADLDRLKPASEQGHHEDCAVSLARKARIR